MKRNGEELISYLPGFWVHRQLTYELLERLTEEQLQAAWPRPGLDTFSKHFQEMSAVQQAFILAMKTGIMDFSTVPDVFSFIDIYDKKKLKTILQQSDLQLEEAFAGEVSAFVKWDDIELPIEGHLVNLISHEVFHHGQMTLAMYYLKIPIPDSWQFNWALPAS